MHAKATIEGKNDIIEKFGPYSLIPRVIEENSINVAANTLVYNASEQNLVTTSNIQGTVYYSLDTELNESNYTDGNNTIPMGEEAGFYTVYWYCTGNENYSSKSGSVDVVIGRKTIAIPTSVANLVYNGESQIGVVEGEEYTLTGNTGTNAGSYTATVTLSDINNLQWSDQTTESKTINWTIDKYNLTSASIENVEKQDYTGNPINPTPGVTVTLAGGNVTTLISGTHFDYSYNDNINVGTATITITAKDGTNYTGNKQVNFIIEQNIISIDIPTAVTNLIYNGESQTGVVEGEGYTLTGNTGTDVGDYTATATLNDTVATQWSDGTTSAKNISWSIERKDATVKANNQEIPREGEIEKTVSQAIIIDEVNGHTLSEITLTQSTAELTTNGTITPSNAKIVDNNNIDVTNNYNLTYSNGVLMVYENINDIFRVSYNSTSANGYVGEGENTVNSIYYDTENNQKRLTLNEYKEWYILEKYNELVEDLEAVLRLKKYDSFDQLILAEAAYNELMDFSIEQVIEQKGLDVSRDEFIAICGGINNYTYADDVLKLLYENEQIIQKIEEKYKKRMQKINRGMTLNEYKEQYIVKCINKELNKNQGGNKYKFKTLDQIMLYLGLYITKEKLVFTIDEFLLCESGVDVEREQCIGEIWGLSNTETYADELLMRYGYTEENILDIEENYYKEINKNKETDELLNEYKEKYIVKSINDNLYEQFGIEFDSIDQYLIYLYTGEMTSLTLDEFFAETGGFTGTREEALVEVLELNSVETYADELLSNLGYTNADIKQIEEEFYNENNNEGNKIKYTLNSYKEQYVVNYINEELSAGGNDFNFQSLDQYYIYSVTGEMTSLTLDKFLAETEGFAGTRKEALVYIFGLESVYTYVNEFLMILGYSEEDIKQIEQEYFESYQEENTLDRYKEQYFLAVVNAEAYEEVGFEFQSLDQFVVYMLTDGETLNLTLEQLLANEGLCLDREEVFAMIWPIENINKYADELLIMAGYTKANIREIEEEYYAIENEGETNSIIPANIKNKTYCITYPDGTTEIVPGSCLKNFQTNYRVKTNEMFEIHIEEVKEYKEFNVNVENILEEFCDEYYRYIPYKNKFRMWL